MAAQTSAIVEHASVGGPGKLVGGGSGVGGGIFVPAGTHGGSLERFAKSMRSVRPCRSDGSEASRNAIPRKVSVALALNATSSCVPAVHRKQRSAMLEVYRSNWTSCVTVKPGVLTRA